MSINNKLRSELVEMFKEDQKAVRTKKFNKIKSKNTKRLKQIIGEIGWPHPKIAGKNGELAAWLIVQHSSDLKFQEKCLKLLKEFPKTKERKQHIAYLIDKILVRKNKKQIYGTQFTKRGTLSPIVDQKNLDKRRKQMALELFKIYKERMERLQENKNKKPLYCLFLFGF